MPARKQYKIAKKVVLTQSLDVKDVDSVFIPLLIGQRTQQKNEKSSETETSHQEYVSLQTKEDMIGDNIFLNLWHRAKEGSRHSKPFPI